MFSQLYDHKQLFAIHNTEIRFKIVKGTCLMQILSLYNYVSVDVYHCCFLQSVTPTTVVFKTTPLVFKPVFKPFSKSLLQKVPNYEVYLAFPLYFQKVKIEFPSLPYTRYRGSVFQVRGKKLDVQKIYDFSKVVS